MVSGRAEGLGDLLSADFPSAELAEHAADLLPCVPAGAGAQIGEGPSFRVECAAGVVRLVARDLAKRERTENRDREAPCPVLVDPETGRVYGSGGRRPEGVPVWSGRSRSRLVQAVAAADWRALFVQGVPVMVTLTYPGSWEVLAGSAEVTKGHLAAFRKRLGRLLGERSAAGAVAKMVGDPVCELAAVGLWKLEFQRRGAPHVHILLALPHGMTLGSFRSWVASAWNEIVFSGRAHWSPGVLLGERARHLAAGTAVDLREGMRCRDPKRIAVYFLKHSAKTLDSKEFQHIVPELWRETGGAGRFWGFWGVERPTAVRYVRVGDFVRLRRTIRRWAAANGRVVGRGGRLAGCYVVVNDGPAFLSSLARALALAA